MNKFTKIALFWFFEAVMFVAFSWGLVMLAYKLFRAGQVAAGLVAILLHLLICVLTMWLVTRPGELRRRARRDMFVGVIVGVWLIGTWVAGLKL